METLIDQRLGEVQGRNAGAFKEAIIEQRFMHAGAFERRAQSIF